MKRALLYDLEAENCVRCICCAHRCRLSPGKKGLCNQRFNDNGTLFTNAYGYVVAAAVDPVEKKPLFHFLPGSKTFSIAVPGCNFRCGFCQNWEISQYSGDQNAVQGSLQMPPDKIVQAAIDAECSSIAFTYTEPSIFFEYALDTAQIAQQKGLKTIFVSNGYLTNEALSVIAPFLDACNIDLKAFSNRFYNMHCKAQLQPVLDTIKNIASNGIHLEVTTLLIPGENDTPEEVKETARFIASVSTDIPWHVSRFFPRYNFRNHPVTPEKTILDAVATGQDCGLRYVYGGNIGGNADTCCSSCQMVLIRRHGFTTNDSAIRYGRCPRCGTTIHGLWK